MKSIFSVNLGIRFSVELFSFLALIIIGVTKLSFPGNLIWGLAVPLVFALIWGLVIAPKSKILVPVVLKLAIECMIFYVVFSFLKFSFTDVWANLYFMISILNSVICKIAERKKF